VIVEVEDLVPGARYQVDYKHLHLNRGFRFTGTYLERGEDGDDGPVVVFEVKPRFGPPARQPVAIAALVQIAPAPDPA